MPDHPQSTPHPWNPADSFRETTLICIDDPVSREALRQVGRLIYDMAVETTDFPDKDSITRAELRAAAAELRFVEGFLRSVRKSAQDSCLEPADDDLAHFAGKLAAKVGDLAGSIEGELS